VTSSWFFSSTLSDESSPKLHTVHSLCCILHYPIFYIYVTWQ